LLAKTVQPIFTKKNRWKGGTWAMKKTIRFWW